MSNPNQKGDDCDVLIQGAGIAGLTLAIALNQRGYRIKIVERSSRLAEVGAGIWMAPNAMQVFDRLGLAQSITDAGWAGERLLLQDYKAGDLQVTDVSQVARQYGFETIALHRGVLLRLLNERLDASSIAFGCEVHS